MLVVCSGCCNQAELLEIHLRLFHVLLLQRQDDARGVKPRPCDASHATAGEEEDDGAGAEVLASAEGTA